MGGAEMAMGVLNEMQEFDQQIGAARAVPGSWPWSGGPAGSVDDIE